MNEEKEDMEQKQKMKTVYYSHIEYGEVKIPDGLYSKEAMDYLLERFERGEDFCVYDKGETIFMEGEKPEEYNVLNQMHQSSYQNGISQKIKKQA